MRRTRKKFFRRYRKILILVAVILIFLAILPLFLFSSNKDKPLARLTTKKLPQIEQYYLPISHFTDAKDNIGFLELTNLLKGNSGKTIYLTSDTEADLKKIFKTESFGSQVRVINSSVVEEVAAESNSYGIIPFDQSNPRVKSLSLDNKYLWDKPQEYALKITKNSDKAPFDPQKLTKLTTVGDVILGRHVAYKMRSYNDYTHPWLKMAAFLRSSDLTFADLETPLSNRYPPPDEGMSFITPQAALAGIKLAGIDIVALANNHSTNYGLNVFTDTLALLQKNGIRYTGGGLNEPEAYKPAIVEKNGLKFAFVDFNSIIGALNAKDDTAGVAKFDIKPWAETDNEQDIARIAKIITQAKKDADIVVAEFHWGVEYQPDPISSQVKVAHRAIESGADLVIGTHPHIVQGMEYYQNTPILYSLGNFIFDQEWSIETKQGTLADHYFYGKKLVATKLTPYQIEDYNQPNPATSAQKKQILDRIFNASLSKDYQY